MILIYSIFLILVSVYSYSLIDVNLTLFNNRYWEVFRGIMINLGYYQRELNANLYLLIIAVLFIFSLYFIRNANRFSPIRLGIVAGLILLFSYPFLSHDLFNYIFDAKIVTFYHKLPYFFRPMDFPNDPWLRFMHWTHRYYPYGPSFLLFSLIPSLLSFNKFILAFFSFKLMSVIFYFMAVFCLNKMNRKWAVIFATSPLILIEGLINSHNDLIAASLGIIGLYFLINKGRGLLSRIVFLLSGGIKFNTLPFVLFSKNKTIINKFVFLIFALPMSYLLLTREIQPWYFIPFFAFLPFFANELLKFNFFSFGLLVSSYFFIRFGTVDNSQGGNKNIIIFIFLVLNLFYLFVKNVVIKTPSKKTKLIVLGTIFIIGIISRFIIIGETAFFVNDQARDLMGPYNILVNGKFTLIGPATSFAANLGNIYFGPYYFYFLLPFYAISKNPYFITLVFPSLFILGALVFLKVKEIVFFEKIFFLLLIFSSWTVLFYTRFLWNINLSFLLSFILFSLFLLNKKQIQTSLVLTLFFGLVSGAIFQIHYSVFFLYVGFIYLYSKNIKTLTTYILGFLASFIPFLLFDLRHNHVILNNLINFIQSFRFNFGTDSGSFFFIFAKFYDNLLFPLIPLADSIKIAVGLVIFVAIIYYLFKNRNEINKLLIVLFISFLISFFFFRREFDHYLASFAIWYYLGLTIVLGGLFKKKGWRMYLALFFILIFFVINMIKYFSTASNVFAVNKQIGMSQAIYENENVVERNNKIEGKNIRRINKIRLEVFPHKDDIGSIEYLLMTKYNMRISKTEGNKYRICYFDMCPIKSRDLKLKDNILVVFEIKDLAVYHFKWD